ncbi:ubiquitin conjugation factor E4 [Lepidopterella palustris CBS 459.81]|uniref:Ubiquitin conjugation factor E4 n=1 Tax=Lepidopterella palustris CBS 459.81 TaxID=1314670 RepID=A0A8E2EDA0_9PEZI|nr:ubiquitin conjugation factor E4 [Lepidopterella palustris CBS 459.81]
MADSQSDADKIRMKRLAKLGGQPTTNSSSSTSFVPAASPPLSSTPNPEETQPPLAQAPEDSKTPEPSKNNPFSQLGMKPDSKPPPRINIKPKPTSPQNGDGTSEARSRSQVGNIQSLATWEDRTLRSVFRLSLDPGTTSDAHGHQLFYIPGVKADLEEEGGAVQLCTDILDQAILEAASNLPEGKPLDYLLGCWKRVSRMFRGMRSGDKDSLRFRALKEARRICFSYCIFAATMPDMFGQEPSPVNPLTEHLLVDSENDRGICHDFLNEAVSRFDEDDSVKEALVGAMEQLSRQLAMLSMNDDYKPYVMAMRNFVRYQPLLVALTQSPMFLPSDVPVHDIESKTLLGPFFHLSPMQGEVALNYFSSPKTRDKAYIANSQMALRMTLQTHQDELFDIANCFLKTKDSREKILDWFALVVNANHKRRAIQVDPKAVSSDGFMVNITVILDRLCGPFMDATFSRIDRIDVEYLRRHPRVRIDDETKINADQHASDRFYAETVGGSNNFITEIFFLTVAAHYYGTEATNTMLSQLQRDVKWMEKQLEKWEVERHKFAQNPAQLAVYEAHLKKLKDQLEKGHCTILAIQGVLLDEDSQRRSMQFMRYVIVWLLRLVSPGLDFPTKPLQLPLNEDQSEVFKYLPEYFVEDIVDNFKFITRNMPHIITPTQCDELVMICITFLRSSEYIKNPYLKSGLVTILFHGVWPVPRQAKGVLGDVLFASDFATKHLLHALMKFYIECESTGTHTQFFDKFNIRYEIFQVIRCIWPNPIYRENLATEARVNLDFFVRFVNLLLNDVTFVLDESFTAFKQIHDLQKELRNPPESLDANARQEKEEALSAAQGKAKSYMQLTNETVAMLKLFTEALEDSFTKPEIVQRLADMLDYNLDALVGPKNTNLKIENGEEYGWNPKQMLSEIVDVYLNLKEKESFQKAVARDGRSYKPESFTMATTIMQRFALKSAEQLKDWERLANLIQTAREADEQEELDFGDVPDEFLDPLLATLMEDPVILPKSRVTIDRSTIRSHLLSDPNDPFNRSPLKIEEVIPDADMKAKIEAFKAEKRGKKQAAPPAVADEGDPMDTSA